MAITQNPIVGRMSGTLGNAVGAKWKGKNTLRAKALTVRNPKTDGQLKQRAKFAILVGVAKSFKSLIKIGFREVALAVTEFNAFMSTNSSNDFMTFANNAWSYDVSKLQLSKGSLDGTDASSITASANANTVTINWPTATSGSQSNGDKLVAAVFNDDVAGSTLASVSRSAGTAVISVTGDLQIGDDVNIIYFFVSADGRKVSDSVYAIHTV